MGPARADVFVENFRRATTAAWGLDAPTLHAAHPGLVYCTISGYGPAGPDCARPGYDFAPVAPVAEALASPQARALGLVRTVAHPTAGALSLVGSPLHFAGAVPPPAARPRSWASTRRRFWPSWGRLNFEF